MEFRSLKEPELDRWAEHCFTVFSEAGHGVKKEYFLRHFYDDPWRDVDGIFVAVEGERIASTVRVFPRTVWLLDRPVPMGGIGEVSTNPEYRGRGLAGTLLMMASDWMARKGIHVSQLLTGYYDFYRRYGWECIPKATVRLERAGGLPCEGRPLRQEDYPKLIAIDGASRRTNWMVLRDSPGYWARWMPSELKKCVVATDAGQPVAWLAYALGEAEWRVREFRAVPGFEHLYDGLCALAAALEGRQTQPFEAPAWLPTENTVLETQRGMYNMVKLVTPFLAGGAAIDSAARLIEATGEVQDSDIDHF